MSATSDTAPARLGYAVLLCLLLAGCSEQEQPPAPYVQHVRVEPARLNTGVRTASGTGELKSRVESELSFKGIGRVITAEFNAGDHVSKGQVLAALDDTEQRADVASAKAAVTAQEAALRIATTALKRKQTLTKTGVAPRKDLDSAQQEYQSAVNDLNAAKARLASAQDGLSQTRLIAEADGVITARNIEVGQVVQPSAAAYGLAHDGDLDAVFNVEEAALSGAPPQAITVRLVSDPAIKATATVREISPVVDTTLGTVRVKLSIPQAPKEMTLGSAVTAEVTLTEPKRVAISWQAMFSLNGTPAVWRVDPQGKTAALRPLVIDRYEADNVVIASGIEAGDLIVTAGGQFLRDHQQVAYTLETAP